MDLLIFLGGIASGAVVALWAVHYIRTSSPSEALSVTAARPDEGVPTYMTDSLTAASNAVVRHEFPSLDERDLVKAIARTYRDERVYERHGCRLLARDERDLRADYEAELGRRREAAKALEAV